VYRIEEGLDRGEQYTLVREEAPGRVSRISQRTEEVGRLFENQYEADGGEQTFDDTRGNEGGDFAGVANSQDDLHDPGHEYREQKGGKRTEGSDLRGDHGGKPRGGAAHTGVRAAEHPDNKAANDAGHDAGKERGT
jgi:hypothetical protein